MARKLLCMVLCCAFLMGIGVPAAYAQETEQTASSVSEGIQPRLTYIASANAYLTISNGVATCTTIVKASSDITQIKIVMHLEKKTLFWWNDVTSWTQIFSGNTANMRETYAVSGGTYRVRSEIRVSKSSSDFEDTTVYSSEVS